MSSGLTAIPKIGRSAMSKKRITKRAQQLANELATTSSRSPEDFFWPLLKFCEKLQYRVLIQDQLNVRQPLDQPIDLRSKNG